MSKFWVATGVQKEKQTAPQSCDGSRACLAEVGLRFLKETKINVTYQPTWWWPTKCFPLKSCSVSLVSVLNFVDWRDILRGRHVYGLQFSEVLMWSAPWIGSYDCTRSSNLDFEHDIRIVDFSGPVKAEIVSESWIFRVNLSS